jgi:hypothetical protein
MPHSEQRVYVEAETARAPVRQGRRALAVV